MSDIKQKARELLGAEYKRTHDANPKCNFDEATYGCALRAIEAALRTRTPDAGGRDDTRRLDSGCIKITGRDEFGDTVTTLHCGLNLRAGIDAAIAEREGL